jgi:plasmid stabilization system protein ParE
MARKQIRYRPEAVAELEQAEQWLRARDGRAADRWLEAAGQVIEAISESPELKTNSEFEKFSFAHSRMSLPTASTTTW